MNDHLSSRISSAMDLPTLPAIVERLRRAIENPECGAAEVGELVAQDPTLTAKILLLANSALYGRAEHCWSAREACALLGLESVGNLVVHATLLDRYEHLKQSGYDVSALWHDAPLVASCASKLSRCMRVRRRPSADEAWLAGLLHDIGQLILLERAGEHYVTIQSAASCGIEPLEAYELRELGCTHSEIGAIAVEAWGCGEHVRDAVQRHHAEPSPSMPPLTALVAVGDRIVERLKENKFTAAVDTATPAMLAALGLQRQQVADVVEAVYASVRGSHASPGGIRAPLPSAPPKSRPDEEPSG